MFHRTILGRKAIILKITIIGAGRVGSALAKRLYKRGHHIQQIFSRQLEKAKALATEVEAHGIDQFAALKAGAEVYILAVHDDGIAAVAEQLSELSEGGAIVAHTSGATPMAALESCENHGVFYPLQTFSAEIPPDFEELPFCIAANNSRNEQILFELAESICPNVYCINEEQRQSLHVTAVMVNNFSNHLFALADQICQAQGVDFEILKPLIRQTVRKLEQAAPAEVQTGPAARGDLGTIDRHLAWLREKAPEVVELYELLTKSITQFEDLRM
jgi:predicted short-subunit dehydrogenase-like oxidoreductase (DUF2520 family)